MGNRVFRKTKLPIEAKMIGSQVYEVSNWPVGQGFLCLFDTSCILQDEEKNVTTFK